MFMKSKFLFNSLRRNIQIFTTNPKQLFYNTGIRQYITSKDIQKIQEIKEFEKALELGHHKKYNESYEYLEQALEKIDQEYGPKHLFSIYILKRMASLEILRKGEKSCLLRIGKEIVNICESELLEREPLNAAAEAENMLRYMIQLEGESTLTTILKFIPPLEALNLTDQDKQIRDAILANLHFDSGIAYAFMWQLHDAKLAFEKALKLGTAKMFRNSVYNNLGIVSFWNSIVQEDQARLNAIDNSETFEDYKTGQQLLKKSILAVEDYYEREYEDEQQKDRVLNFVDVILNVDEDLYEHDLSSFLDEHALDEELRTKIITKVESLIPFGNLAEMAYVLQKPHLAFKLLDMVSRSYNQLKPESGLLFKYMSLLATGLLVQGYEEEARALFKQIIEPMKDTENLPKAYALKAFGGALMLNENTKTEGLEYVQQAEFIGGAAMKSISIYGSLVLLLPDFSFNSSINI